MINKSNEWMDISQPLTNEIGHWPGDTPFSYELSYTKEQTGSVNIGRITTSLHTGTHVDAPFHFDNYGLKIHELNLHIFIGKARVVDFSNEEVITVQSFKQIHFEGEERILIKTSLKNDPNRFPNEWPKLDPNIASYLKDLGVVLVGIDLPSVDPLTSKDLPVHHAFHKNNIHILENIMLDHVEEGTYELIALPLPIVGGDGSLVRAVIRKYDNTKGDNK